MAALSTQVKLTSFRQGEQREGWPDPLDRLANPDYMDEKNTTKCVFMTNKRNLNTKACHPWHLNLDNPCRNDELYGYLWLLRLQDGYQKIENRD